MSLRTTTLAHGTPLSPSARTQLHGARLGLARAGWAFVAAASIGLYALLLPLILRASDYGDWQIETSAEFFGINPLSNAFDTYALILLGVKYLAVAFFFGVALFIFWRKSDDWMAILVSITLFVLPHTFNLVGSTENWYLYHFPWDKFLYALDALFNGIGFALLFLVFFLFPDGHFVPRGTRWLAFAPFLVIAVIWGSELFSVTLIADDRIPWLALILFFITLLLLATSSQVHRYRHVSTPAQQTQTRIVVTGLVIMVAMLMLMLFISLIGIPFAAPSFLDSALGALVNFVVGAFVLTLLPLAFGVAMLRDQLWQSERVLNRAVLYFALTAILLVVYIFVIGALSEIFRRSVLDSNNFVIAAIATGIVALLFQPLRARLQRGINRFLYGQRNEPFTVLNHLGAQLENSIAPETALPLIVETIVKNLRVPYAAVTLSDESKALRTEYGMPAQSFILNTFPLKYQNETVGALQVARRAPNENFSSADVQLLENLARHAGAAAYTARLHAQLQQSRERIINERENERRRLRRDLHDGLGPTLASQTLKLDAALELLNDDTRANHAARAILLQLKTQTQNTVADIRRIVYELRPPALDDLGLAGALRAHLAQSHNTNGMHITLDAPDDLPPLSAAVQVNAYRIVIEAVNNALKHARAQNCAVLIRAEDALHLEIADDGVGLPENFRAGVGIASMRERAEELGGTFHIEANEPRGVRVSARLPTADNVR